MKTFFTTMLIFLVILTILGLVFRDSIADWFVDNTNHARAEKPVIYLYHVEKTDIHVRLALDGALTVSYPADAAELEIEPAPDTVIRVFMVWQALDAELEIPAQILPKAMAREGFTVVEWGGTEIMG